MLVGLSVSLSQVCFFGILQAVFASPLQPNCTLRPAKANKNDGKTPVLSNSYVDFDAKATLSGPENLRM